MSNENILFTVLPWILGSTLLTGIITTIANYFHSNRQSKISNIVEERAAWRERIRGIALKLNSKELVQDAITELKVNINPYGKFGYVTPDKFNTDEEFWINNDGYVWASITDVERSIHNGIYDETKVCTLIEALGVLLKLDWERSKKEIQGEKFKRWLQFGVLLYYVIFLTVVLASFSIFFPAYDGTSAIIEHYGSIGLLIIIELSVPAAIIGFVKLSVSRSNEKKINVYSILSLIPLALPFFIQTKIELTHMLVFMTSISAVIWILIWIKTDTKIAKLELTKWVLNSNERNRKELQLPSQSQNFIYNSKSGSEIKVRFIIKKGYIDPCDKKYYNIPLEVLGTNITEKSGYPILVTDFVPKVLFTKDFKGKYRSTSSIIRTKSVVVPGGDIQIDMGQSFYSKFELKLKIFTPNNPVEDKKILDIESSIYLVAPEKLNSDGLDLINETKFVAFNYNGDVISVDDNLVK